MVDKPSGKETWGTRIGVILAVTGSAVGLGNFLRFPGLAAKYDGGAFMVPYFLAFLLLGLPIAWVEWSMGRYGGSRGFNSSPGIYRLIWPSKSAPYFGVLSMIVPVMIYMYYVYVEAWCLAYAVRYLFGLWESNGTSEAYERFFSTFVGKDAHGAAFAQATENLLTSSVFFLALCFVINFTLIYRGVTKGIEWFCKWAMPALLVCALLVLLRVLTLGTPDPSKPDQNVLNGLGFMWNPSTHHASFWESLANPEMWLEAAGQIFFSLSVGFGIIVTYASYLRKDDDIALSSVTAAAGNEFCEVALGGMITVPAAYVFLGKPFLESLRENPVSTFGLGFVTLPNVFNQMIFGQVVGFLFFFLLFLAALIVRGVLEWAFTQARWEVITANLRLFMVGQYPVAAIWRIWACVALLALLIGAELMGVLGALIAVPAAVAIAVIVVELTTGEAPARARPEEEEAA